MLRGKRRTRGFTLVEVLVVVALVSILSAIAMPTYSHFVSIQRLNISREKIHRSLQEIQSNAKRDKLTWQASFRNAPQGQFVIHKKLPNQFDLNQLDWQNLGQNIIIIDGENQNETTFYQYRSGVNRGIWRMQFNPYGHPNGQLGRITVGFKNSDPRNKQRPLRCVIVSTLLGAMRTSHEQPKLQNRRYCY